MFNFVHIACVFGFLNFRGGHSPDCGVLFFARFICVLPTFSSVFVAASVSGPFGAEAFGADVVVCVVCVRCVNALFSAVSAVLTHRRMYHLRSGG